MREREPVAVGKGDGREASLQSHKTQRKSSHDQLVFSFVQGYSPLPPDSPQSARRNTKAEGRYRTVAVLVCAANAR
jgi:hypothetical protein